MSVGTAGVGPGDLHGMDGAYNPFWFDLWQTVGWSGRVERIWSTDTAYRSKDRSFLDVVLPTLAPEHKTYVEHVLRTEQSQ